MELQRYTDVEAFLAAAGDFLVAREAEHNLLLGVCQTVRDTPDAYTAPPYFATVSDGDRILTVALQTPPFQLVISEVDDPEALPCSPTTSSAVICRGRSGRSSTCERSWTSAPPAARRRHVLRPRSGSSS